jgi:uncharacterized membrane protein
MGDDTNPRPRARRRLIVMLGAGIVSAVAAGLLVGWLYAPTAGWIVACIVYMTWVWLRIGRMDAAATKRHAGQEDPTRPRADLLTLAASVASLGAIVYLLVATREAKGATALVVALLALASVALSWLLIHTLFTLRYAELYYEDAPGGVDFSQDAAPRYSDFAYLSFTIGMTYQVSDTNLRDHRIRITALRHALLSYLFGAVILAATINLLVGFAQ